MAIVKKSIPLFRECRDLLSVSVEIEIDENATHEEIVAAAINKAKDNDELEWDFHSSIEVLPIDPVYTNPGDY